MENASKALIIAASVLVAIMLVAMGVTIFNRAQSSADTSGLEQTEINMFNSKFERYAGNQMGSQVKSLISFAISNASTNGEDPIKLPDILLYNKPYGGHTSAYGGKGAVDDKSGYVDDLGEVRSALVSTKTYTVTVQYAADGLINRIEIRMPELESEPE